MTDEVTEVVQEREINQKGYTITRLGRQLIARSLATGTPMVWTGIMIGQGAPPGDVELPDVEALGNPVAPGTSTVPQYLKDRVSLTVEFRSDMVPGNKGFYITEFGIFAQLEGDEEPILFVYGCQGDYPVWVGAYGDGCTDIRRWPITLVIGSGLQVGTGYSPGAFMTAEDIEEYAQTILLPQLADMMGTPGVPHVEIMLDPDAWEETESGGATCRVPVEGVTARNLPLVSYGQEYGTDLAECGMSELVEAVDGALIFWAQKAPTNPIPAHVFLLGESSVAGSGGGSAPVMRPATATTLGAIKGSDSLKIDPDGTAHAVLSDAMFASDEQVSQALDDIYGTGRE